MKKQKNLFVTLFVIIGLISGVPAQNTWTVKASFGGAIRQDAVGFSMVP